MKQQHLANNNCRRNLNNYLLKILDFEYSSLRQSILCEVKKRSTQTLEKQKALHLGVSACFSLLLGAKAECLNILLIY